MPELPEVETVVRELNQALEKHPRLLNIIFNRADLREKMPQLQLRGLLGQRILRLRRRAKYLLFEMENGILINHLGMTGSWRVAQKESGEKHDHVILVWDDGRCFIYNDPRRFGLIDFSETDKIHLHKRFKNLGFEPLEGEGFEAGFLKQLKARKAPIKAVLMDQRILVGVGNIYACEILFKAKLHPFKKASLLKLAQVNALLRMTRETLLEAIKFGGSSISDYKKLTGEAGSFQNQHFVYGRNGEACKVCGQKIKSKMLSGRNTFWCPDCQK